MTKRKRKEKETVWWQATLTFAKPDDMRLVIEQCQVVKYRLHALYIYFARYTDEKTFRANVKICLEARLWNARQIKHAFQKTFYAAKKCEVALCGEGSRIHAAAFDMAAVADYTKCSHYDFLDAIHWMKNMLGFNYAAEAASDAIATAMMFSQFVGQKDVCLSNQMFGEILKLRDRERHAVAG